MHNVIRISFSPSFSLFSFIFWTTCTRRGRERYHGATGFAGSGFFRLNFLIHFGLSIGKDSEHLLGSTLLRLHTNEYQVADTFYEETIVFKCGVVGRGRG